MGWANWLLNLWRPRPPSLQPGDKVVSEAFVRSWETATVHTSLWIRWLILRETLLREREFWASRGLEVHSFRENGDNLLISETLRKTLEAIPGGSLRAGVTGLSVFSELKWTAQEAVALGHPQLAGSSVLFQRVDAVVAPDPAVQARNAVVAEAFDRTPFLTQDQGGSLEGLRARLASMARKWLETMEFYAPYFALVNASMMGKSRLISQLRTKGVFLGIICLRPDSQPTLRPPRTESVAQWIETASRNLSPDVFLSQCCILQLGLVQEITTWLQKQPSGSPVAALSERWYDYLHSSEEGPKIWSRLVAEAERSSRYPKPTSVNSTPALVTEFILSHWREQIKRALQTFTELLRAKCPKSERDSLTGEASDVRVLLVVDEASGLTQANPSAGDLHVFLWFRRALQAIPFYEKNTAKMFSIFTDTTSRIANLAPPAAVDSSGRVLTNRSLLFPPFTVLNTIDLWWNKARRMELPNAKANSLDGTLPGNQGATMKELFGDGARVGTAETSLEARATMELMETYWFNAQFGRPAHMAFLLHADSSGPSTLHGLLRTKLLGEVMYLGKKRTRMEDVDDENVVDFRDFEVGKSNMMCILKPRTDRYPLSQVQALGLFGAVASIHVSASSRLATELSAGHMRPLLFASKLRKFVYTSEISEPLAALGGHSAILACGWHQILDKYLHSQLNQSTVSGLLGEVAAQTLVLMAWQTVAPSQSLTIPFMPAFRFLEVFMGKKLEHVSQETADTLHLMREHLQGGFVRVNQIVKTVSELSLDLLHDYLIRASAVFPKRGQQGFDLAVQMYFPKNPIAPEGLAAARLGSSEAVAQAMNETVRHVVPGAFKTEEIPSFEALKRTAEVTVDGVSNIDIQAKNHRSFTTRPMKQTWLDSRDKATKFLHENAALPTVSLLLEFNSGRFAEEEVGSDRSEGEGMSDAYRSRAQLMARARVVKTPKGSNVNYVICLCSVAPSDILQDLNDTEKSAVDTSFQRLLECREDIMTSGNIDDADLELSLSVHHVQPDYHLQPPKLRKPRQTLSKIDFDN